jgi:copper chaperone CopZ
MNRPLAALASLSLLATTAFAADKPGVTPHPVTLTFLISGMECGGCTAMISQSVNQVKGVTNVDLEIIGGCGNISFDTHVASAHQIAQAIADALPVHGKPFAAALRFRVPDYAKEGNAAKVDAVFAKRKGWVEVEAVDRAKGEFVAHFLPLKIDEKKPGPQGWNPGHFGHAIHDPSPKGLGLAFALVADGQDPPAKGTAEQSK